MNGNWESELRKMKKQFNEEIMKTQEKEKTSSTSNESELMKLQKLLESQLLPVVKVFNEEGLTKMQQPHIHQHKNGYTLVVPVAEPGVRPIILKLEFELLHNNNEYALKIIHDTPKNSPPAEKIMEQVLCSEERIREEIRTFLIERQNIILEIKKKPKQK